MWDVCWQQLHQVTNGQRQYQRLSKNWAPLSSWRRCWSSCRRVFWMVEAFNWNRVVWLCWSKSNWKAAESLIYVSQMLESSLHVLFAGGITYYGWSTYPSPNVPPAEIRPYERLVSQFVSLNKAWLIPYLGGPNKLGVKKLGANQKWKGFSWRTFQPPFVGRWLIEVETVSIGDDEKGSSWCPVYLEDHPS